MSASQTTPIVVAVDGGQSSTLALVAEGYGHILGVGWGGPSNHVHEPGGVERLQSALRFLYDPLVQGRYALEGRRRDPW